MGQQGTPTSTFDRFQTLRFLLVVLVIYIHNKDLGANIAGDRLASQPSGTLLYLVEFLSMGLARVAVPLFFFMSGYLFFYRMQWSLASFRRKLASRAQSLLIPYVIWNVLLFAALYAAQQIPAMAAFFSKDKLSLDPGFGLIDTIFGLTHYPIAYQFWFIRDLMALVVLTPLLHVLSRTIGLWLLVPLMLLWISRVWPVHFPSSEATLFFYAGACLALRGLSPFALDSRYRWCLAVGIGAFLLRPLIDDENLARVLFCSGIVVTLVGLLGLSRVLSSHGTLYRWLDRLALTSFFIFAMHEPVLTVLRKLAYRLLPANDLTAGAIYLGLPLMVTAIGIVGWMILNKPTPSVLRIMTGGR